MNQEQITIIGGGPVGISLALKLAQAQKNILVLDEFRSQRDSDRRVLALSHASLALLEEIGVDLYDVGTPIDMVHISHNGLGVNRINATDLGMDHLGYTVKYPDIIAKLYAELANFPNITLKKARVKSVQTDYGVARVSYEDLEQEIVRDNYLSSSLVVLAEGGNVGVDGIDYKEYDYNKYAVVGYIETGGNHNNIAYERFEQRGPLVLLPHGIGYVVIWALDRLEVENLTNDDLAIQLKSLPFMSRFDDFKVVGDVAKFPLRLKVAKNRVLGNSLVLVGNSSQIVHPVSAQGLNLGLRDIRDLAELLIYSDNSATALASYSNCRKSDQLFVSGFTHFLARFLELQHPVVNHLRGLGIIGLSNCRFLQNKLTHSLIFGITA